MDNFLAPERFTKYNVWYMEEIKNKLNISKITVKNLFLIILLMAVMAIVGIIAKSIGGKVANINTVQAQSCWTTPPGGGGGGGGGSACASDGSSSAGSSCGSDGESSF